MAKIFGIVFIAGGILTTIIALAFRAFANAMVGMSDSTTTNTDLSSLDKLIVLVCAYFFVSALGLFIFKSKRVLWIWAAFAQILLLIAYTTICIGFHVKVLMAAAIAAYYSPWLVIWFYVLKRKNRPSLPG